MATSRWRAVAFGAAALLLAACASSAPVPSAAPQWGGDIASAIDIIRTPDPAVADMVDSIEQVLMVYEPLYRFDVTTGRPLPAAASALPVVSADGLRYRVTLRSGLVFSDRVPVRAADFAYGLSRLCDPAMGASYASTLAVVVGCAEWLAMQPTEPPDALASGRRRLMTDGLRVLSDDELEIVLRHPAPYFTSVLGLWLAVPVRQVDVERGGVRWANDPATYVGNGPFVLREYTAGERLVFARNERARVPAKLRSWTKLMITDMQRRPDEYRVGRLDIARVAQLDLAAVAADPALTKDLRRVPNDCTYYLRLNTFRPPLDDVNVRLALAKGLDRDAYVRDVRPAAQPAMSLIPPGLPGHDAADVAQRFDPAEVRRLLAASRYRGAELAVTLAWPANNRAAPRFGEWFAAQWSRNVGVTVRLQQMPLGEWVATLRREETTPHITLAGWCGDYPDPHNWHTTLFASFSTQQASALYRSDAVDALLAQADRESDAATRESLYTRTGRMISADAPAIWLAWGVDLVLVRPAVRDLHGTGQWHPELVWVDEAAK